MQCPKKKKKKWVAFSRDTAVLFNDYETILVTGTNRNGRLSDLLVQSKQ